VPGKANRLLQSRVDAVFAQWPDTRSRFSEHTAVHVTGCPVRPEFKLVQRAEGLEHFGLDADKKVLLVTGASHGAHSVNEAVIAAVPALADAGVWGQWQLLHLTGSNDQAQAEAAYRQHEVTARVVGFTKHMALALAAADLVLARAGASTLAEITAVGRPAILMPYPHHGDLHQVANARMLVKFGAARMVQDRIDPKLNAPILNDVLLRLIGNQDELAQMAASAQRIGTTNGATQVAQHLLRLAQRQRRGERLESMEELCVAGR
jgi:UDP-N-acetylglucosamine--N-acetylmuramyl-(pentapeptide) pyrophosphoryl-undecaprenol N-acetylglucosamine transferase